MPSLQQVPGKLVTPVATTSTNEKCSAFSKRVPAPPNGSPAGPAAGLENDSMCTPTLTGAELDYTVAPSTVTNHFHIDNMQFARMRDVANRRAARVVNSSLVPLHPPNCDTEHLLAYNELFAEAIVARDPKYFDRLAEQQRPEFLYIGCSDSRVVANEIMGLGPGEIFVHRNVANIVSPSDLNMLSALQYSVEHLLVRHVIVSGHYKCGGVTAALHSIQLGLADHWVSHVVDVKKIHWARIAKEIPAEHHLDALCELNVLAQVSHLVDTHIVQNIWERQNQAEDERKAERGKAAGGASAPAASAKQPLHPREIVIHGWIYGLQDGLIKQLVTLTRRCNPDERIAAAEEEVFARYRSDDKKKNGTS